MNTLARRRLAGFTLIELLVVIAILTLLISILVPAVNSVRRTAKRTATQSTLQGISTALENYRVDQTIGGAFPPSFSDSDASGNAPPVGNVANPYGNGTLQISGAGLLVWALAGADQLGTPGFRKVRSGSRFWSQDTDATSSNGGGAYYVNTTTGQPQYARLGPLVDLSKVRLTPRNASGTYDVPAEKAVTSVSPVRAYPMFLDSFDQPVLYYRADVAGTRLADNADPSNPGAAGARGIFHVIDNNELVGTTPLAGVNLRPLVMSESGKPHRLDYDTSLTPANPLALPTRQGTFQYFIHDKNITAKGTPQLKDSFLLISAGPDGRFGTTDDLTNFNANGSN